MVTDGSFASADESTSTQRAAQSARRLGWGIGLLFAFEVILVFYTLSLGSTSFALTAAACSALLGVAWWQARGAHAPTSALLFGGLGLLTLYRALVQTLGPGRPLGLYMTYFVPVGFLLAALHPRLGRFALAWGIGLVAGARSWFVVWYFLSGNTTLVTANALGALGGFLWLAAVLAHASPVERASHR